MVKFRLEFLQELVEITGLIYAGFGLDELASIYPQLMMVVWILRELSMKQLVQKFMNDGSDENLFNEEEDSDSDEFN